MCAMWGHTPGGRHLRLGENRAKSSRGASGMPRLRTEELQARPGSEQNIHGAVFQRTLHVPDLFVYMTSNPVNNRGAANKRQPGTFSVGCRFLHLGLPSALLCPALLRGSPAVF